MGFTIGTAIAAIGVAVSAAGTIAGVSQANAQRKQQKKLQELEMNKNNLEAQRQRREIYRRTIAAQASSEASAASQGGLGGSGLGGGLAQAANAGLQSTAGVNQNLQFATQAGQIQQRMNQPNWGGFMQSIGGGLMDVGKFFNNNDKQIKEAWN